jgi:hypothetical protein
LFKYQGIEAKLITPKPCSETSWASADDDYVMHEGSSKAPNADLMPVLGVRRLVGALECGGLPPLML